MFHGWIKKLGIKGVDLKNYEPEDHTGPIIIDLKYREKKNPLSSRIILRLMREKKGLLLQKSGWNGDVVLEGNHSDF